MAIDPELFERIHQIVDSRIEPIRVHREEHEELKASVRRLEESHARVENELARLAAAQRETQESLLRFQRSTEERFNALERRVEELAQAQARTEQRLEALAEAQARTERRLEALAEAQARTERRVEALAEAQARTQEALKELAEAMRDLRREVGGLSARVGSDLEEIGRIVVAEFLREEEGVELPSLEGRYLQVDGEEIEVDLFGEGRRGGQPVVVIGECKARVYPRELETFHRRSERLARVLGKPVIRVVYCQRVHPEAERFARETGIIFVPWSYQHRIWAQGA